MATTNPTRKERTDEMALEADATTRKRARWGSFSFVLAAAGDNGVKVNVANHSHGEDEVTDHTYTVTVDEGGPAECTCPAYEYHTDAGEACKHMVAVAETEPVLMAALECVAAGGRLTEPDAVTDGGRAPVRPTDDVHCEQAGCGDYPAHVVTFDDPDGGELEITYCERHTECARQQMFVEDVREVGRT